MPAGGVLRRAPSVGRASWERRGTGANAQSRSSKSFKSAFSSRLASGTSRRITEDRIGTYAETCVDYLTGAQIRCRLCATCRREYKLGTRRGECVPCTDANGGCGLVSVVLYAVVAHTVFVLFIVCAVMIHRINTDDFNGAEAVRRILLNLWQPYLKRSKLTGLG